MNGSDERAAKRVKVEDDNAPSASASPSTSGQAVASTSTAGQVKQETTSTSTTATPSTSANGARSNDAAKKEEQDADFDDNYGLYEDYASNAEVVPPSGDLYLDTVSGNELHT